MGSVQVPRHHQCQGSPPYSPQSLALNPHNVSPKARERSRPGRREPLNSLLYSEHNLWWLRLWQICDFNWWWEWVAGTSWDSAAFVLFAIPCRLLTAKNVRRGERENCLGQLSLAAMENLETKAARARNNIFFFPPGRDSPVYSEP